MQAKVFVNHNRQTCIVYSKEDGLVQAVTMQSPELGLLEMGHDQFHSQWAQVEGYEAKKAAYRYLNGHIPYNHEVKSILEKIMSEATAVEGAATKATKKGKAGSSDVTVTKAKPAAAKKAAKADNKAEAFFKEQEAKKAAKAAAAPAKGKKEAAAEPKAKAGRKPAEDISEKVIHLLPAAEDKRFQEGSVRSQCFAVIKDGMKVKAYLAAVAKKGICEEKAAIGCLTKLIDTNQKTPTVELKDK